MSKRDAYKQKMEAELELVQAKISEFKARAKNSSADIQIKYAKEIEDVEHGYGTVRAHLNKLGEASESAWEDFKVEAESAWNTLSTNVKNVAARISA